MAQLTNGLSNPLDDPMVWRALVTSLNSVAGVSGDYIAIHDAIFIEAFCGAFDIPLSAVSERLETYVHACPGGIN
jgi:hypothetical protein